MRLTEHASLEQIEEYVAAGRPVPPAFREFMDPASRPRMTPELARYFDAFFTLDKTRVRPAPIAISEMLAYRDMIGIPNTPRSFVKIIQAVDDDVNKAARESTNKPNA